MELNVEGVEQMVLYLNYVAIMTTIIFGLLLKWRQS
jgi:hypothetical protein